MDLLNLLRSFKNQMIVRVGQFRMRIDDYRSPSHRVAILVLVSRSPVID